MNACFDCSDIYEKTEYDSSHSKTNALSGRTRSIRNRDEEDEYFDEEEEEEETEVVSVARSACVAFHVQCWLWRFSAPLR